MTEIPTLDTDQAEPGDDRWPYPWQRDEDPDYVDPETGVWLRDLQDHGDPSYLRWWNEMREKYGYPRENHVKMWVPRYRDWLKQ